MKIMLATEQALSMSFYHRRRRSNRRRSRPARTPAALLRNPDADIEIPRHPRWARKVCGDALGDARWASGYIEEFATARLLRDAHLGSIWEGTGNIVALDALKRAGRPFNGAEAALSADLHARLDDSASVPQAWRDRLARSQRSRGWASPAR